jgi:retinol dehydrogenase-13
MNLFPNSDKTAAVTGATGAIGKAVAFDLAKRGYRVILLVRDSNKARTATAEIKQKTGNEFVDFHLVDLSLQSSIESLANSWERPLNILVNNAAISPQNRQETADGIELQFATNVLGYFWMTKYFVDILIHSAPSRIVNVASYWAGGLDIEDLEFTRRPYHNHDAYRQSKQANRMLSTIMADDYDPSLLTINSCHPGDVNSSLSNSLGFGGSQSPQAGAKTPSWLATSEELEGISGNYFEFMKEVSCPFSKNKKDSKRLLDICLSYTK